MKKDRHILLNYDFCEPVLRTKETLQYLVSLRSHRRLTAFSCGPMANHNLLVRLAVAMGCGTLWLVGLTARMTLHICFNRCYVVMQACVQFPE
jgi:hypothetical protein